MCMLVLLLFGRAKWTGGRFKEQYLSQCLLHVMVKLILTTDGV